MMNAKTQIGDVTYNAATQCFEALVTFYTERGAVRVASTFKAPVSTEFETAVKGLWQNAQSSLDRPDALQACLLTPRTVPPHRTARHEVIRAAVHAAHQKAA